MMMMMMMMYFYMSLSLHIILVFSFSKKTTVENDVPSPSRPELPDCAGFETDSFLHRNRGIPTFAGNPFSDLDAFEPDLQEPTSVFYNDGKGVENGVDSTTYFWAGGRIYWSVKKCIHL